MSSTSESQASAPTKRRRRPGSTPAKRYPTDLTDAQWSLVEPLLALDSPHLPLVGARRSTPAGRSSTRSCTWIGPACAWQLLPTCVPPWGDGLLALGPVEDERHRGLDRLRFAMPSVALVFADGGSVGRLVDGARRVLRVALEIVRKPEGPGWLRGAATALGGRATSGPFRRHHRGTGNTPRWVRESAARRHGLWSADRWWSPRRRVGMGTFDMPGRAGSRAGTALAVIMTVLEAI